MNKKIWGKGLALGLAAVCAAGVFAGCNNENKGEINADELNGYKMRVAAYRDFPSDPLNNSYIPGAEKFKEKYPGVDVEFITVSDAAPDSIAAAIAAGDVWELQYVFGVSRLPGDIVNGIYQPIDGYFDPEDSRLDMSTVKATYFDGKYFGVSNNNMQEFNYFSYNETYFKELGVKTPHEYYAEGKWNIDSFMEICKALYEKDAKIGVGSFWRPDWVAKHATKWNEDLTQVEITLDSAESKAILEKWRTLIYDYKITDGVAESADTAGRGTAIKSDVAPNLMISNNASSTTDTIRYIFFPSHKAEEAKPHIYLTDAQFMLPSGSKMQAAAIDLALDMCEARRDYMNNYYREVMTEEGYNMIMEAMKDSKVIPHMFPDFQFPHLNFNEEMKTGKPVSTYVSEKVTSMKAAAESFNEKLAAYRAENN